MPKEIDPFADWSGWEEREALAILNKRKLNEQRSAAKGRRQRMGTNAPRRIIPAKEMGSRPSKGKTGVVATAQRADQPSRQEGKVRRRSKAK
jgi:hypothetical protein